MGETAAMKYRASMGRCRFAIVALVLVCLALLIALIVVSVKLHDARRLNDELKEEMTSQDKLKSNDTGKTNETEEETPEVLCPDRSHQINLDPPEVLPPFHDLTAFEINKVKEFLYKQTDLNLVRPPGITANSSYIFSMELLIPNKDITLNYLDNGQVQPPREARVVIFRGDVPENTVEEYVVGPLPSPAYKKDKKKLPFLYRPFTFPEVVPAIDILTNRVDQEVSHILEESYGGRLVGCSDKCLKFQMATAVSSAITGDSSTRKIWFWLSYGVEFKTLQMVDFQVLMDVTSSRSDEYKIDKVLYAGEAFGSLGELADAYKNGVLNKTKVPFPTVDRNLFSSMNRRGTLFPQKPLQPPEQYNPSGLRYAIQGRHISYMGWDFDVRMSPVSGPQVFDIRYNNERIVYELSLQEINVMYSGDGPAIRITDIADSNSLIGIRARSLVPNYDCPEHATFLNSDQTHEIADQAMSVYCVFEHNTGVPLRRHHEQADAPKFYEGMVDTVLTLRTIATIANYDYIIDFIFHQNGAVEVKVIPTGFILSSFWHKAEEDYGFRLKDHVVGNIHIHLFHFKVDMDINGRENRFETLDIVPVEVDNSKWSKIPNARYAQTKFERRQVRTEREAAIKYNFDTPRYLTFYNNNNKTEFGVPQAYRLLVNGMTKQLYPKNQGQEASYSWARYQVAVTKYKETEKHSSSLFSSLDAANPVVNFEDFLADNEVISDEDQVTWVTMGLHHIPHTEDLPVTPTVGLALQFFLLPYNYFPEDPAMGSSDAIRIEPKVPENIFLGMKMERYGRPSDPRCMPRQALFFGKTYAEVLQEYPFILFDP